MTITDAALVAAAALSNRYITARQLPDKAIDLVDEAMSRLKMEIDSSPVEIDQLKRSVDRMSIEELALKKEKDDASKARLAKLRDELLEKERELLVLEERWTRERASLTRVGDLKKKLDEAYTARDRAMREANYAEASRLEYTTIKELQEHLDAAEQAESAPGEDRMVNEQVTEEDIAAVIAAWTGIPVGRLLQGETEKLLHLESELGRRLIGQKPAVAAVSDAVRRSRAGISDPNRPDRDRSCSSGRPESARPSSPRPSPTSCSMTSEAMVRIDMSEYGEKHSVSRLVGAPPGYIGYEQGGQLTEAVRRRPYSVILLDEVEKAHPEVFDILLQVLDDGRLTDGQGRTVDFRNVILVLTSNLGSQYLVDPSLDVGREGARRATAGASGLQARVREPPRRHRRVLGAVRRTSWPRSSTSTSTGCRRGWASVGCSWR